MVKVNTDVNGEPLPCEIYLDGYLKSNLELEREFIKRNFDSISIIFGPEGAGKTVFAMHKCLYSDAGFNLDRIVFTAEQLEKQIDNAPKGSAILFDESDVLASRWWDDLLAVLIKKFKRIRSKNLNITLVTPTLFDMNKYFAIHRARYAVYVYNEGFNRGFFKFYDYQKKKYMYLEGKKTWNINVTKPTFYGRFTDLPADFPITWDEYNEKKDRAMEAIINASDKKKGKRYDMIEYRRGAVRRLQQLMLYKKGIDAKFTNTELGTIFGVSEATIREDKQNI